MTLKFMALSYHSPVIILAFSGSERRWPVPDLFVMTIDDGDALIAEVKAHGQATRRVQDGGLGISLNLSDTCESPFQSLRAVVGEATFYALETHKSAPVRGKVTFDLEDWRTGEVVGESFVVNFDFEVLVGTPFQAFVTQ
jgi:hypothetical protein